MSVETWFALHPASADVDKDFLLLSGKHRFHFNKLKIQLKGIQEGSRVPYSFPSSATRQATVSLPRATEPPNMTHPNTSLSFVRFQILVPLQNQPKSVLTFKKNRSRHPPASRKSALGVARQTTSRRCSLGGEVWASLTVDSHGKFQPTKVYHRWSGAKWTSSILTLEGDFHISNVLATSSRWLQLTNPNIPGVVLLSFMIRGPADLRG